MEKIIQETTQSSASDQISVPPVPNLVSNKPKFRIRVLIVGIIIFILFVGVVFSTSNIIPKSHTNQDRQIKIVSPTKSITSPKNSVRVTLGNFPNTIKAGGPPVQFTATLTNDSNSTLNDVAPLFQIVGGPCNCALGSLEQFDSTNNTWRMAQMPEGDGDPNFLTEATGEINLHPSKSFTFHYRLTLASSNPAKSLNAVVYAVQLPAGTQLGIVSIPTQIIKSE